MPSRQGEPGQGDIDATHVGAAVRRRHPRLRRVRGHGDGGLDAEDRSGPDDRNGTRRRGVRVGELLHGRRRSERNGRQRDTDGADVDRLRMETANPRPAHRDAARAPRRRLLPRRRELHRRRHVERQDRQCPVQRALGRQLVERPGSPAQRPDRQPLRRLVRRRKILLRGRRVELRRHLRRGLERQRVDRADGPGPERQRSPSARRLLHLLHQLHRRRRVQGRQREPPVRGPLERRRMVAGDGAQPRRKQRSDRLRRLLHDRLRPARSSAATPTARASRGRSPSAGTAPNGRSRRASTRAKDSTACPASRASPRRSASRPAKPTPRSGSA